MFRSIRWRIAAGYVIVVLLVMAALAVYMSVFVRDVRLADASQQLRADVRLIAEAAQPALASGQSPDVLDSLAQRYAAVLGARVTIISPEGAVVGESHADRAAMDEHGSRPEVVQALSAGEGFSVRRSRTLGSDMMYAAARVAVGGQTVGVVRASLPLPQVETSVARLNRTLVITTLVAALAVIILAILIAERTARPLRQLTHVVERMARGDLSARFHPSNRDEVLRLAEAVNHMAAELQTQLDALTDQRNKLVAVLTHMSDGAVITDKDGRVQLINPAAGQLLGLAHGPAASDSFVSVARDHQVVEVWRRCQQTGEEQSDVVEVGGKGPFLRVVATPLRGAPQGGCLIILQDLTQVRRLETVRRDFISNISHELRTPLASLQALVDTLRGGALDDPPAAERFLNQMDAQVDSLTQMVRELLELSRIESGNVPFRLVPTSVTDLVGSPLERLRPQAERAGLRVSVSLPPDLPAVLADAERVQQVVTNIVHNAIKFTPPGGEITVWAERETDRVIIAVRDTGVGISADDLPRIFERFYKADRARSGGGTGLGLAIAKHIVQAHGGRIWAESAEGQGSTFRFTLSMAP